MNEKRCYSCKQLLPLEMFYNNKTRLNNKEYECKNCEAKRKRERRNRYREEWKAWLNEKYGKSPKCQICENSLEYFGGKGGTGLCWDHRNGGNEIIKRSPATWLWDCPCTIENQDIFASCDFGILCSDCNKKLLTHYKKRREFLIRALLYTMPNKDKVIKLINSVYSKEK